MYIYVYIQEKKKKSVCTCEYMSNEQKKKGIKKDEEIDRTKEKYKMQRKNTFFDIWCNLSIKRPFAIRRIEYVPVEQQNSSIVPCKTLTTELKCLRGEGKRKKGGGRKGEIK